MPTSESISEVFVLKNPPTLVVRSISSPYTCLGLADFQSHYGSAPISIVWKMKEPLPGFVMKKTVKV